MSLSDANIEDAVARYVRERDRYEKLVAYVADECRSIIRDKNIRATVSARAKTADSLRKKLHKLRDDSRFGSVEEVFKSISDLAGVRVSTYIESDRQRVVEALQSAFEIGSGGIEHKDKTKDSSGKPVFGKHYRAIHCQVQLKLPGVDVMATAERAFLENVLDTKCEVQVCSLLAHVWNELEHDIGYKPENGAPTEAISRVLETLGQLVAAGDHLVQGLITEQERAASKAPTDKEFEDHYDLVVRLRARFATATNFRWYSAQLLDALREQGLDRPTKIEQDLLQGDYEALAHKLIGEVNTYQKEQAIPYVELDASSSDLLAALFLNSYYEKFLDIHPTGKGRGRPSRLVSIAKRFEWMRRPT